MRFLGRALSSHISMVATRLSNRLVLTKWRLTLVAVTAYFVVIASCQSAVAETVLVADLSQSGFSSWQSKQFSGRTDYVTTQIDNQKALKAVTRSSASALYKKLKIDLNKTPYLNWSWRIDNVYSISDQRQKTGDDFPARVYVVVKEGYLPWQTKALNYVWSNTNTDLAYWPNPFTKKAMMIPVRSGKRGLGKWHRERVNIKEDFYRIFNRHIDSIDGIAIMSDSDNAKGSAVAYYGTISFSD